jgi:serine O-acetyltransferase
LTTFGVARRDVNHDIPTIEARVDIGCGVGIFGDVVIGHDSSIGANSVVLRDVPPYSVAVGAPAKVIKTLTPSAEKTEKAPEPAPASA